ncbi:MAG: chemotaxis protein CheW [Solirubrobacterales bacterium]|jgi:purine-binding chemotaxis protein CheW
MPTLQEPPVGEPALGLPRNGRDPGGRLSVVVFSVDGAVCAVPLHATERALRMVAVSPLPGAPAILAGVISLHGSVVPVVDLRRRLGSAPRAYGLSAHLLLVRSPRRRLALSADQVVGVQTIPGDSVVPSPMVAPGLRTIAGIAAIPGGLLFIYDLEAVLSAEDEERLDRALAAR